MKLKINLKVVFENCVIRKNVVKNSNGDGDGDDDDDDDKKSNTLKYVTNFIITVIKNDMQLKRSLN